MERTVEGTMIIFTEDCDRDLKAKEAAASMSLPAGDGKKEAVASERRVPLANVLPNESKPEARLAGAGKKRKERTAEALPAGAGNKMEEAAVEKMPASGDGALNMGVGGRSLFKEGEMLRLREELLEAELLWKDCRVEGALDRWLERKKAKQAPADDTQKKKKKKVVRVIVHDDYIPYIKENHHFMRELSDEEMAKCPKEYRQTYEINKIINAKDRAYLKALMEQFETFGFAYDEKEVTDDEEDEDVVVKN